MYCQLHLESVSRTEQTCPTKPKALTIWTFTKKLNILDSEVRRAESAREVHGVPLGVLLERTQEQFLLTIFTKVDI